MLEAAKSNDGSLDAYSFAEKQAGDRLSNLPVEELEGFHRRVLVPIASTETRISHRDSRDSRLDLAPRPSLS